MMEVKRKQRLKEMVDIEEDWVKSRKSGEEERREDQRRENKDQNYVCKEEIMLE